MDEGPPKKVMLDFFNRLLFKKTSLSEHDRKSFKMARRGELFFCRICSLLTRFFFCLCVEIQEISQPIPVIPIMELAKTSKQSL